MIILLAMVLALNSADSGTIGAVGAPLEADLGISHAQLGLFATVSSGVGAVAAPVAGVLADRTVRVRLLVVTIAVWGVSMVVGGLAPNYTALLLSRIALGAAVAAAGPIVASLIGDLFQPGERAKIFGWVLTGELVGAGLALLIGGDIAAWLTWRAPFLGLGVISLGLAAAIWKLMPEPRRGGASRLAPAAGLRPAGTRDAGDRPGDASDPTRERILHEGVPPESDRILRRDPDRMSFWQAARFVLGIRTVRTLIIATAVGYFFFAGLRTFALIFALDRFGLSQGLVSLVVIPIGIGAVAGTVFGGRLTDREVRRGHTRARITVPAVAYSAAALLFLPGLVAADIWISVAFFTLGALFLAGANPPLGAARLDIVPAALWGRAESVRTVLQLAAEAAGPIAFGFTADELGGAGGRGAGLREAFLIMLVPLLLNGLLLLRARHTYRTDVATAAAGRKGGQRTDQRPSVSADPSRSNPAANRSGGRWPNPTRNTRSDS
ncbi:MFS transporter [Asanoa sp. NPDC049573]|uniref:MFS transporter n=1 Tax=Asanoa sp. NPDC049573 TaxID=3155396 RepID=UPI00343851AA